MVYVTCISISWKKNKLGGIGSKGMNIQEILISSATSEAGQL